MADVAQKIQKNFTKINIEDIQIGVRFSAPVFFDDGQNMFLSEGKSAKQYHVASLKRWNVPYLLSFGHIIDETKKTGTQDAVDGVDEIEELEELEELEDEVV